MGRKKRKNQISLFKSIIEKNMARDSEVQLIYLHIEGIVNSAYSEGLVSTKPLSKKLKPKIGFFISKLLDFITVSMEDFSQMEFNSVKQLQTHIINGGTVDAFFKDEKHLKDQWAQLLLRTDVTNHFFADISGSELESSSSSDSPPEGGSGAPSVAAPEEPQEDGATTSGPPEKRNKKQ